MAATESNMLELGTKAPYFQLFDTLSREMVSLEDAKGEKGTVVMFICNHCPYVHHVIKTIIEVANEYKAKGISFVGISSNDVENYPDDHPDIMKVVAQICRFPFPYLYDENQEVAKNYDAACTPDFFVFDNDLKLVYRGRLDESRPKTDAISDGKDIRKALDSLVNGKPVDATQYPSIGCNIKWKK
jgi:thiol-disulfide isomerase/thioredoxin